jgi:hypothetical protein
MKIKGVAQSFGYFINNSGLQLGDFFTNSAGHPAYLPKAYSEYFFKREKMSTHIYAYACMSA